MHTGRGDKIQLLIKNYLKVRLKEDLTFQHHVRFTALKDVLRALLAEVDQNLAFVEELHVTTADCRKENSLEVVCREAEEPSVEKLFGVYLQSTILNLFPAPASKQSK